MPRYAVYVTAKKACGCWADCEFELNEGEVPTPMDVGCVLSNALDPEQTDLLTFLTKPDRHSTHGTEKLTVTAELKVR